MPSSRFAVLQQGHFARYLLARLCGNIAVQVQTVAVGWQVYAITGNPLDLGLVGLSQFLPFVLLILPAGQVADHFDRRRIMTLCYLLQTGCALALLVFTLTGLAAVWPVFAAMALFGIGRAFAMPASQAILPNLVPREQFASAVALNSSVHQASTVVGPALGGLLYLAGAPVVYGVVVVLALAAVLLMAGLGAGGRTQPVREPVSWGTLLSGLSFVWSRPVVFGAISLDLFAVLFGGATALLPVFARDILHVGPVGLGLLRTAPAAGAVLCGLWLAVMPIQRHVGRWMFGGVAVFGLATLLFGCSTHFLLSLAALTVLGAGDMVSVYIRHLLVQMETPDDIRGRVSAVNAVFIGASNELGEFESGLTAAWWGSVRSVLVGGVATMMVAATWARYFPVLWRMDRFPGSAAQR